MVVEPDCFSSPWVDSIRFQLALLGQRGPRPLKRKVQGKFTSIVLPWLHNRKGKKKERKKRRNLQFVTCLCHESFSGFSLFLSIKLCNRENENLECILDCIHYGLLYHHS